MMASMVATKTNHELYNALLQAKPVGQAMLVKLHCEGLTLCLAGLAPELRMQEA